MIRSFSARIRIMTLAACVGALTMLSAASASTTVGWIEVKGSLKDQPDPLGWLAGEQAMTLRDLVGSIERAADRDDLSALVLRLREPALTTTQVEELGEALTALRKNGKKVHLFTEIYGPVELMLGAYTDDVVMQSGGAVSFPGMHMEEMFLADTLNWLGVKADFVQIGDYKGASEMFVNSEPSKAWDENISNLLDSMYTVMRGHITSGRGMNDRALDRAMEKAWYASGEDAIKAGLIDAEVDRLSFDDHLQRRHRGSVSYETNLTPDRSGRTRDMMSNPFALFQTLMSKPTHRPTRNTIAVLNINGAIVDGESTPAGLFGGGTVGSLTIREALKTIEDESLIKGVVVRIDSPGGSAIASESIWLGLRRVAEKKPVWVSVGSMAASGGYYIAVGGDRIYANPSSIVGSIGVVGGKFVMADAYDKLRINVVPRSRGPQATLFSTVQTWDEKQRRFVADRMTETYDLFVNRVKSARKRIDIAKTAEGRLFTGSDAIELRMVDKIGGMQTAITDLADELGLEEGRYDVMNYPGPKSLEDLLGQMFKGFGVAAERPASGAAVEALRELVGPRAWASLRDSLTAMWQLRREPVLTVAPTFLIFR